jgi:predicted metal-dependent enzyme (double-stranded beta helix superfamily)
MFDKERFIEDCRAALAERTPQDAIRELVERAVRKPAGIVRALGAPTRSGVEKVHHAPDLTILNLSWGPLMNVRPHDHRMWAIIGIYGGCEQNTFFRRNGQGLDRHGTRELGSGEAVRLGPDAIHAVKNPLDSITSAIHVYLGDFFAIQRSEWHPDTLVEASYDMKHTMQEFEEANQRLRARLSGA